MVIVTEKGEPRAEFFEFASAAWELFERPGNAERGIYRRHYVSGRFSRWEWRLVETERLPAGEIGASAA